MRLIAVRLNRFGSYRKAQEFIFPDKPGLYFMQGVNEAEPRLEGNGTGKSTLWRAITWCLYGTTSGGLKAGDISNWDEGKNASVELDWDFYTDGCWTMKRTWSPNSWTLDNGGAAIDLTKDPSNPILAALRLDFEAWQACIVTAQGRPMFLDQKHDVQAALFSEIMGLDYWLEASAKASARASRQDETNRGLERDIAKAEGRLQELGRVDYGQQAADWARVHSIKLNELAVDHEAVVRKRRGLKERAQALYDAEDLARAKLKRLEEDTAERKAPEQAARAKVEEAIRALSKAEALVTPARRLVEFFEDHAHCPTCDQDIPVTVKRAKLAKASRELEEAITHVNVCLADHGREKGRLETAARALSDVLAGVMNARDDLNDAVDAVKGIQRQILECDHRLDALEDQVDRVASERNPYGEIQATADREHYELENHLSDLRQDLDESQSQHALFSYWVKGFKELRLSLIAESLTELEIEVNSSITALGLVGWEIHFQVDRETKSGTIKRGFNTYVKSPHNSQPVPWEAWSGGEKQRLRVAGNMGVANLVRSRSGCTLPLEVWDEPTAGLSPQGVQDLLQALVTRAETEQRCVWLIDHTARDFGGFSGGATVIKTPTGSRIRQY